jgi:hypothetical protein
MPSCDGSNLHGHHVRVSCSFERSLQRGAVVSKNALHRQTSTGLCEGKVVRLRNRTLPFPCLRGALVRVRGRVAKTWL